MRVVDLEEISIRCYEEAETPAFAKNDSVGSGPSLITIEKSKVGVRKMTELTINNAHAA